MAASSNANTDLTQTPVKRIIIDNAPTTPHIVSHQHLTGEVTLTPTHRSFTPQSANPHNSMTAITPIASAVNQAKSSIKLQ